MKHILLSLFLFAAISGVSQTRQSVTVPTGITNGMVPFRSGGVWIGKDTGALLLAYSNALNTKATLVTVTALRALSTPSSGMIYLVTDVGRSGLFYWDAADITSADNDGTIFTQGSGGTKRVYKRIFDGYNYVVEWFNVVGDGVTDNSAAMQKAVNAAQYGKLNFTGGKIYLFNNVRPPLNGIYLQGNGAILRPYFPTYSANALFLFAPGRLRLTDGLYGGSTVVGSATSVRTQKNIVVDGFIVDGQYTATNFVSIDQVDSYNIVDNVRIINNRGINCAGTWINIAGTASSAIIPGVTGKVTNVTIAGNINENAGYFLRIVADSGYSAGATSINLYSLDPHISLASKVRVGRYIQFATAELTAVASGGNLAAATFTNSNAIYQVTGFTPSSTDSSRGSITIASGVYSTTTGWTVDVSNTGLQSPIVKNAWIIPPSATDVNLLLTLPQFNFTSGSNTMTRTTSSTSEDAAAKNLFVGQRFFLSSGGPVGIYTITAIDGATGAITTDINSSSTSSGQRLNQLGSLGKSVRVIYDCQNINVENNIFVGGSHGVHVENGVRGKGLMWKDIQTSVHVRRNVIKNMWMSLEAFTSNSVASPFSLGTLSITAAGTTITPTTPSNFRYVSKDLNGDGSPESYLTLSGTTDPNATLTNTLGIGDLIRLEGVKGIYQIIGIPSDWPTTSAITVTRFNPETMQAESGGFYHTASSIGSFLRVYSPELGANETVGTLEMDDNTLEYNIRAAGGYNVSANANIIKLTNNRVKNCERSSFEINGDRLEFYGNTVINRVWNNDLQSPGITATSTGPANRSAGQFMYLYATNIDIKQNDFIAVQPDSSIYSDQSGGFVMNKFLNSPYTSRSMVFANNTVTGIRGRLLIANNTKTISSTSYPIIFYDLFKVSENTLNFLLRFDVSTACTLLYGQANVIQNNSIKYINGNRLLKFLEQDNPNSEIFTTYKTDLIDNTFSLPTPLGGTSISTKANISTGNRSYVRVADAAYTLLGSDYQVAFSSITAPRAITLPTAASVVGQHFLVNDESGSVTGTNKITFIGNVDGATNPDAVTTARGVKKIYSNGTAFFSE